MEKLNDGLDCKVEVLVVELVSQQDAVVGIVQLHLELDHLCDVDPEGKNQRLALVVEISLSSLPDFAQRTSDDISVHAKTCKHFSIYVLYK